MATCGDRVLQEYAAEMCRPVAMASNRMSLTQWHTRESSNQKPLVHALARQWLRCTRGHLLTTCSAAGTVLPASGRRQRVHAVFVLREATMPRRCGSVLMHMQIALRPDLASMYK